MFRIALAAVPAALALLLFAPRLMGVEQPRYEVLERSETLELRLYEPHLVAETEVHGELRRSSDRAFRRLAGYIFGDNRPAAGAGDGPQKIEMTSPVNMEPAGDGGWRMAFIMPAEHTMESLPEPADPAVRLRREPGGLHAAVRFSGSPGEAAFEERTAELRRWIGERGWVATGRPVLARYDPPWTPPPMRRNEVLIPVRPADAGEEPGGGPAAEAGR